MEKKTMRIDDASLVKQTLEGNRQAFDSLVIKYNASIYKLILSYVKNPEDAQELTQEAFIDAYTRLVSLHESEKFYNWLRQIAINRCRNWKRNSYIAYLPLDEDIKSIEPSPEEAIILKETLTKIIDAINRLPEPDKSLIAERYFEDISYEELQKKYGISSKALGMRLHRAKQRVKGWVRGLFASFPWLRLIKIGVIESMKISLTKKLAIVGLSTLLVLGSITGTVWYRYKSTQRESATMSDQAMKGQSSVSVDKAGGADVSKRKSETQSAKGLSETSEDELTEKETRKAINEAIKWLDSLNSKEKSLTASSKDLSPEMKEKAELFAKLSQILPAFKESYRTWGDKLSQAQYLSFEERMKALDESEKALERSNELLDKIISLCDPILKPPAIEKDERGVVQIINISDICIQLAEYFDKKLPFDGNPDYLAAENYNGTTGWE